MTRDAIIAERNLVVPNRLAAVAPTAIGAAATTVADVLGQPDETVQGYFHGEAAQVIAIPGVAVDQVVGKLVGIGVPTIIVYELTDPERAP